MRQANWIERLAERLRLIPDLNSQATPPLPPLVPPGSLADYPPIEHWDDWAEYEATTWPRREKRNYVIVPTACFNCEAGCGLLGYVDRETLRTRKFEGNPYHPASRGRNCAKGPATINQVNDPDRILHPLRRKGARGAGGWQRLRWDDVLDDIAGRIRRALEEGRHNEVAYHVGRPGHEGDAERVLQSWGVDGHNSHTNICSSGARFGYAIWQGADRPSPDYANSDFILLLSAHLESGHYFNPHAQRIVEGMMNGAKLAVMDPRLSNTASMADCWMPTYPGSEAAVLLAMARVILVEELFDGDFLRDWVNWEAYLDSRGRRTSFQELPRALAEEYAEFTPEFAEKESGVPAATIVEVARRIGRAGSRFASHNWRSASSGNLGGWCVSRALHFLNVLTGSVGTPGGTLPSAWNKFKPPLFDRPPAQKFWNELHFPNEYPLSHYEMSFLLPHFLKEGRGRLSVYFTRVFNPVWTYPDGFSWIEALRDEEKIGLHAALTPTWSETAFFADYVLPMGHASERHDLISYETHAGLWIGFRQPIGREARRRVGDPVEFTYQANPGEVWEEDEFWIELSWRIDPDGTMGIREHFTSPYRQGEKITVEEYYRWIFEHTPGLPEKAAEEDLSPLDYMRRYGAFELDKACYRKHLEELTAKELSDAEIGEDGCVRRDGITVGVQVGGRVVKGFETPSRKQEIYSPTLVEWGWPEHDVPGYVPSHIHPDELGREAGELVLVPTFRLPTLIHSRSGNAKWLAEISNRNPLWIHPRDAHRLGVEDGALVRVTTDIGYFIDRAWVTESMRPGVAACSHHLGRWRRSGDPAANRWASNLVDIREADKDDTGALWTMRVQRPIEPQESGDPDSKRIFWKEGGVHQNIAFPVHPDPVSGMHCWHQRVRLEPARPSDRCGDVQVDTRRSMRIYRQWLSKTRPAPGPGGLRRPLWLNRPLRPAEECFYINEE